MATKAAANRAAGPAYDGPYMVGQEVVVDFSSLPAKGESTEKCVILELFGGSNHLLVKRPNSKTATIAPGRVVS